MKNKFNILLVSAAFILLSSCSSTQDNDFVQYVDPLIGTAPSKTVSALKHSIETENNAQVIPSVTMPFGMTNWTPQTRNVEEKCIAPYYYKDSLMSGFRGSHWLSGSCTQDYGSVTIMPVSGGLKYLAEERSSRYSHSNEIASPYYYKVHLDNYNIDAELTASKRTGLLRFTYNDSEKGYIVIEPNSDENEGYVEILPEKNEIVGYNPVHRIYQGWGDPAGFSGYFVARFSQPFDSFGVYQKDSLFTGQKQISNKENVGAFASFVLTGSKKISVKIGTSFTSIENARKNLDEETSNLEFDDAKEQLKEVWEKMLSSVKVESDSSDEKTKFYTALYHSFQQPRLYNDCDGSYPSFNGGKEILNSGNTDYYDDFSVWDTYRALQPLLNILMPDYSKNMSGSLMLKAEQGGWLPIFPCWNSYTSAMIGDHVIAIIADAYIKGVIDITEEQYQYLKKNAVQSPDSFEDYVNGKGRRALKSYLQYGYVPLEDEVKESFHTNEQVSRTLEYSFDDFALSQIAERMGKQDDYKYFLNRSKNYKNVFDAETKCVRGRYEDGTFIENFDKTKRVSFITEGTPWQYTWYVPQDIDGLISLMGGVDEFNKNLDDFFAAEQYWHGNEPGHQIPFLYTYSGQPEKTQAIVSHILSEEYSAAPGGLSGNDDAGQMSAWYVFAALGFYPITPGTDEYAVFAPHFEKSTIKFPGGKELEIIAKGLNEGKKKVKEIKLNGKNIQNNRINHSDLIHGGVLEFLMEE